MSENFQKLESDVSIVKNMNNILLKQMPSIERQCWKNAQYLWHECVEVVGLPSSIEEKDLEPSVCRVLQHIGGVGITGGIDVCHCLKKQSDRTKVKFSKRKD